MVWKFQMTEISEDENFRGTEIKQDGIREGENLAKNDGLQYNAM